MNTFYAFSIIFAIFVNVPNVSARGTRVARQIQQASNSTQLQFINFQNQTANPIVSLNSTNSNSTQPPLQFINFQNQTANPIVPMYDDVEGSGSASGSSYNAQSIYYDGEGSGVEGSGVLYDNSQDQAQQYPANELHQTINVTDVDIDTIVIKVKLPSRGNTSQIIAQLRNDTQQETNLPSSLDTAVSLTGVLSDILSKILSSSSSGNE